MGPTVAEVVKVVKVVRENNSLYTAWKTHNGKAKNIDCFYTAQNLYHINIRKTL
jgi:hypothetical protein